MTALDLSNSQIVTLPSLQGLGSLEKLNLNGSDVTTLLSLKGLTALRELNLSRTRITALPSLEDLSALQKLIGYTGLTALPSLDGLMSLRELNLSHTNLASMPPLEGLTGLQELDLTGTNVTSLPDIQDLPNLHVAPDRLRATAGTSTGAAHDRRDGPDCSAAAPPLRTARSIEAIAGAMGAADALGFACPTSAIGRVEAAVAEADAATPCSGNASDRRNQTDTSAAEEAPPPPAKSMPAPQATVPTPPSGEASSASRRPPESEAALSGYEYFQRGYAASERHDYAEAISLYRRGAEKGDANSMYSLGSYIPRD